MSDDTLAFVVRLATPAGKLFPAMKYLRTAVAEVPTEEDWVDRDGAQVFGLASADRLARKLTRPEAHVYPVILEHCQASAIRREGTVAMAEASALEDWHVGKPNCGVD